MKKLKGVLITLIFVLSFNFVFYINSNARSYAISSSAKAMCVLDRESGRVIYIKNGHEKLPMASTTKIMTAITVIENCTDLNKIITVDDSSIGIEGTSIYLRKDEQVKVKDLLYGLMLRSGNDSAMALACHIGGDLKGFTNLMNALALKIGAKDSHFDNPHGLDSQTHYTTAYDLALISAYALKNPTFKEIVSTKTHVIPETNKSDKRYLTNKNRLLSSLEGCCGVKTGFTSKAGRCLVSAIENENINAVCAVLNCGPMFEESADLLKQATNEYKNTKIIDKYKEIYNEYIIDNNQGKLYLYAEEDFVYPLTADEFDDIKICYNVTLDQAKEGSEVGKLEIYLNNHLLKTLKLFTINKIDKLIDSNTLKINEILWEERINEN